MLISIGVALSQHGSAECYLCVRPPLFDFFFFNDTATTEIYTLSLHDALPISARGRGAAAGRRELRAWSRGAGPGDRKSTRLNSSHVRISYAVFCLKKKKQQTLMTGRHGRRRFQRRGEPRSVLRARRRRPLSAG